MEGQQTASVSILGGLEYQHTYSEYPDLDKTVKCYQLLDLCTLSLTGTQGLVIEAVLLEAHGYQITNVGRCLFSIIKNKLLQS